MIRALSSLAALSVAAMAFAVVAVVTLGTFLTPMSVAPQRVIGTLGLAVAAVGLAAPLAFSLGVLLVLERRRGGVQWLGDGMGAFHRLPTVTVGLAAWWLCIRLLGTGQMLAATLALSIIVIPDLAVGVRRALSEVKPPTREAAILLGATPLQVLSMMVVPASAHRLRAALWWALSRAIAQCSPLLVVAGWERGRPSGFPTLTVGLVEQLETPWAAMDLAFLLLVFAVGARFAAFRAVTEEER